MIDLNEALVDFSVEEKREIAYFLSRYFKGSPYLEEEGKDIFAEVFDEPVSARVKEATLSAVESIESEVGSALEYNEETSQKVLDHITAYEDTLTQEPTDIEKADVYNFFGNAKSPLT
ncbi:hypothetical protein [uncultured Agrobacterium sp.]|uniref:hypothetical protein n=1 Tax=uncultured Agrobacterium sp. TaxID=157277 RepID=UPI0025D7A4D8|nr:hypothetical protein [uncultured Agrobacterium sp.]